MSSYYSKCVSFFFGLGFFSSAVAVDVATCQLTEEPQGYAFYHGAGLIPKREQGWKREKIEGITTIKRINNGEFDVVIHTDQPRSMREDGGKVWLLRKGATDATFLHMYPGRTIEIYTLWRDLDGIDRFDILSSKGGDMRVHKSSVVSGLCSRINFTAIN